MKIKIRTYSNKVFSDFCGLNMPKDINRMEMFFFSIRVFFHRHWQLTGQQGKGGDHLLFHSTTFTRSRTFRHLFATLHVRWHIYQISTPWDLPPYQITVWLIDVMLTFVYLLVELILGFVTAIWHEKRVDSNLHWPSSLYYKRTN